MTFIHTYVLINVHEPCSLFHISCSKIKFIFYFEDHNRNKYFGFVCNPRFIAYMYFIMICIHCILLYMLMVDPIK